MDEKFLKRHLKSIADEHNSLKKALKITAIITEALKIKNIKPILVGGRALEFYTLGGYATKDIDLVIRGREHAKEVFEKLGFTRRPGERHWYNEEMDLAIEVPDEYLAGSTDRVITVEIDNMEAYIIGIEDLIIDRLLAAKFWHSTDDEEWAIKIMALHFKKIDFDYLKEEAHKNQVADLLTSVIDKSKKLIEKL
ncbi:DUF6036 family nucleotidyltransferase [Thermosediminibacter oceani]|uniref:DUF6036 domain-containing protein n=1 Tax=Thermosediminibacter oceani (strain ATCC BAA-1034 / DSM 16646 / JW/IW-1228P) TaxID=555079 RepID=D9S0L3_THEOJ|nr:DUF6036 family nucleotidyltransferase [Thermosediminibacter oceani]ADL08871.1 conserved hypothetical protein [Thermosediminibacter oceani DSM 16646]